MSTKNKYPVFFSCSGFKIDDFLILFQQLIYLLPELSFLWCCVELWEVHEVVWFCVLLCFFSKFIMIPNRYHMLLSEKWIRPTSTSVWWMESIFESWTRTLKFLPSYQTLHFYGEVGYILIYLGQFFSFVWCCCICWCMWCVYVFSWLLSCILSAISDTLPNSKSSRGDASICCVCL